MRSARLGTVVSVAVAVWSLAAGGLAWASPRAQQSPAGATAGSRLVAAMTSVSCSSAGMCVGTDLEGDLVATDNPIGGPQAWSATPVAALVGRTPSVSCTDPTLCVVAAGGDLLTSTDPTGGALAWYEQDIDATTLTDVSCPSISLCVAVDNAGNVLSSTDPAGASTTWSSAQVVGVAGLLGVSCPSVSFCVAWGHGAEGAAVVASSTNPTGGAGAWSASELQAGVAAASPQASFRGISCPTTSLCLAAVFVLPPASSCTGGYHGEWSCGPTLSIAGSTDPTAGAAWQSFDIGGSGSVPDFTGISCPSANLCVAAGNELPSGDGDIGTSTDPTSTAWTSTSIANVMLAAVSCPSSSLCVAVGSREYNGAPGGSNVVTSVDPQAGAWASTNVASSIPAMTAGGFSLTSLTDRKPRLAVTLTVPAQGPAITACSVTLPPGLTFNTNRRQLARGINATGGSPATLRLVRGVLWITPTTPTPTLSLTISTPAITEQASLLKTVDQASTHHRDNHHPTTKSLSLRTVLTVTSLDQSATRFVHITRIG